MAFGTTKQVTGKGGTFETSGVPLELLNELKRNTAIPITIGGTLNITFTVAASKTAPVPIWNGRDFIWLKENLAYTFLGTSNTILHATTGAVTTMTGVSSAAPWYMYVGYDSTGALLLYPSAAEPKYIEGPYQGAILGHPGTARTQFWNYVGYTVCVTASTAPAFIAMTKLGFDYRMSGTAPAGAIVQLPTTFAMIDYSAFLPKHGVQASGYLKSKPKAALINSYFGGGTTAALAQHRFGVGNTVATVNYYNFPPITVSTAGKIFGGTTLAATAFSVAARITTVRDLV